ncbi:MAG: hypothetical protein HY268_01485 [Deltaproteobacteria bacterium]|nr:hypothetical protein [Deltaproteobacteria bacterium]
MATRSATMIVDERLATAYNTAPKARQKKAPSAMRQALQTSIIPVRNLPRLTKQETALFRRINRSLPAERQHRYDELRTKREQERLTPAEHAELLQYVEEIITLWNDRVRALIALARLRRVSPQQLMQQLAIDPHQDDS